MPTKNLNVTVTDVDPAKGITTGYLSHWDNLDSDGDFTVRGKTFVKTLAENGPDAKASIQYLLNHVWDKPAGVFQSIKEDSVGLAYEAQLTKNRSGVFTPRSEEIMALHDTGYKFNHSYGYRVIDQQKTAQGNMLTEVQLYEGSILYGPGANPLTPLTGMKGESFDNMVDLFAVLEKALHRGNWQEETYQLLQKHYDAIGLALKARKPTEPVSTTQPDAPALKAAELIATHFQLKL